MNFWKMISKRWSRQEIASWGSLKKTAYIILPLLIYFVVHDVAEILLWAGLNQLMLKSSEGINIFFMDHAYTVRGIVNGLAILLGVAAIWGIVKKEIERSERQGVFFTSTESILTGYMFLGVFAFLASLGLNVLFNFLKFTASSQSFANTAEAQFGVEFLTGIILYGIVSPFAEEAVFRGVIYNRMKRCFNYPIALVISALLFGCYHGNVVQAAYGTILGVLIAYVYEKYDSFVAPVLFHSIANVGIFAITYYDGLKKLSIPASVSIISVTLIGSIICFIYVRRIKYSEKSSEK